MEKSVKFVLVIRARILGRVMGRNIDFWNCVGTKYVIETAMFYKMLILKAGIDFFLGLRPHPPPTPPQLRINSKTESIESILWNRCQGSLKFKNSGLVDC